MLELDKDRKITTKMDDLILTIRYGLEPQGEDISDCFRGSLGHYKDMMADQLSNVDERIYEQLSHSLK